MAKEDPSKEERKRLKEEKKNKKKLSEENGVKKSTTDKKDKKSSKKREALAEKALNELSHRGKEDEEVAATAPMEEDAKSDDEEGEAEERPAKTGLAARPVGALVPFANPLADEKVAKKVFKSVKKAAAHRTLKRGVKEVVKSLRKSAAATPSSTATPFGIVVLAADISPMDVISHIPVLCEDHNVPYIYVTSRAELGMAGQTKRPTSVVMVVREPAQKKGDGVAAEAAKKKKEGKKKDGDADGEGEGDSWAEIYRGLLKVVEREGRHVKV